MFFFVFFQEGLLRAHTVFDPGFLKTIVIGFLPFNILLLVTAVSIFFLKKSAKFLFPLCVLGASFLSVYNLVGDFSKLVIIALFLFILTAYYFYQFLLIELDEAYYNPQYHLDDLFSPMLKKIHCEVIDEGSGEVCKGILTNWNPNGCFIHLGNGIEDASLKKVTIKMNLSGRMFEAKARLASRAADGLGYGFRMASAKDEEFGWKDFHSIVEQMGYNVELLK